jgi:hypothetical protein
VILIRASRAMRRTVASSTCMVPRSMCWNALWQFLLS